MTLWRALLKDGLCEAPDGSLLRQLTQGTDPLAGGSS